MFCSKCGKTVTQGNEQCPHCSAPIGQTRFEGGSYTSAQPRFEASSRPNYTGAPAYTRTTYTGMDPEREESGDADTRTTYRPVYEGASVPDEIRRDMRSDMEELEDEPQPEMPTDEQFRHRVDLLDKELELEDVDMSQFKSRPITRREQTGISQDVANYISQLEANQEKKATQKSPFASFSLSNLLSRKNAEKDAEEYQDDAEETPSADYDGYVPAEGEEEYGYEGEDHEEYEELRSGAPRFDMRQLTRIAIALVLVAALFVGGVVWFRYVGKESASAPIEGVTLELYNNGIAAIEANASTARINELIAMYNNQGLVSVNSSLSQEAIALAQLMPETPSVNDATFLQAIAAIETNIGNAITMDVLALSDNSATAVADSQARWNIINNSIAQLKASTTAADLNAIINGQQISLAAATPTPAQSTAYATLSYGDKSDAVLDMQNRLYELGFFLEDRDGAYGNKTMTAVKTFQNACGFSEITGIADVATLERLYADDAPRTQFAVVASTPINVAPAA